MQDTTSKTVATVGIWFSAAIILALGVFRVDWNGDALLALVVVVLIVCASATASTAIVWSNRRRSQAPEQRGFEPLPVLPAHSNSAPPRAM
jgi:hypothetical protein